MKRKTDRKFCYALADAIVIKALRSVLYDDQAK